MPSATRRRRNAPLAAFPATLFASGGFGGFYDSGDIGSLYQDSAASTRVTADGDRVGRMSDKSGSAVHVTQTTADARGTYRAGGGLPYIAFDGTDDVLTATFTAQAAAGFVGIAARFDATGTDNAAQLSATTIADSQWQAFINGSDLIISQIRGAANAVLSQGFISNTTAPHVLSAELSTGALSTRVDGIEIDTDATAWPAASLTKLAIGANVTPANYLNGRVYGLIWTVATLTADQIARAEAWLAGKYGASL